MYIWYIYILYIYILPPSRRDFTRFCGKTSVLLVNGGPAIAETGEVNAMTIDASWLCALRKWAAMTGNDKCGWWIKSKMFRYKDKWMRQYYNHLIEKWWWKYLCILCPLKNQRGKTLRKQTKRKHITLFCCYSVYNLLGLAPSLIIVPHCSICLIEIKSMNILLGLIPHHNETL